MNRSGNDSLDFPSGVGGNTVFVKSPNTLEARGSESDGIGEPKRGIRKVETNRGGIPEIGGQMGKSDSRKILDENVVI